MTQKGDIGILSNGDSISYKRTLRQKSPKFTALVLFSAACETVPFQFGNIQTDPRPKLLRKRRWQRALQIIVSRSKVFLGLQTNRLSGVFSILFPETAPTHVLNCDLLD